MRFEVMIGKPTNIFVHEVYLRAMGLIVTKVIIFFQNKHFFIIFLTILAVLETHKVASKN